jgi:hypothetical protein
MFGAPQQPSSIPSGKKPLPEEPAPTSARGRSVALLGLPSSGKTSFLYALTHASARGRHRWIIGLHTKEFERLTGDPNERQEGTPVGEFRPARLFEMSRPWLGAIGVRRGPGFVREVIIPEIAGETVERYALGRELMESERSAVGRLKDYLHHSDEVLFLVGIDGTQGANNGRLRPDSVESAMLSSVKALRTILKDMQDGRERDEPIFVSLLVTKRDRLHGTPLDRVRLASAESSLARLARRPGFRWLASEGLVADGGDEVVFSVKEVCGNARAKHDLDIQEAAAADFLRCHAPRAAADLAELAAQPGISLRLLTIAPYGTPSIDASGAAVFPPLTKIAPSLVFESLDDLVERRFRHGARSRVAWMTTALAVVLLAAVAFGPAWTWYFRGKAEQAISAGQWEVAGRMLLRAGAVPWWRVEIAAPRRAAGDAELVRQILTKLDEGNRLEELKPVAAELQRMLDRADPGGIDARLRKDADGLVEYIRGTGGVPKGRTELDATTATRVITELEASADQRAANRRDSDFVWQAFGERCQSLKEMLESGSITFVGAPSDAKDRLRAAIERGTNRSKLLVEPKGNPRSDLLQERKESAISLGEFSILKRLSDSASGASGTKSLTRRDEMGHELRIEDQQEAGDSLRMLVDGVQRFVEDPQAETGLDLDLMPTWAIDDQSKSVIRDLRVRQRVLKYFGGLKVEGLKSLDLNAVKREAGNWKKPSAQGIAVLGPDGEVATFSVSDVLERQRSQLGQLLDAIDDAIREDPSKELKERWRACGREIRESVGIEDVLFQLAKVLDAASRVGEAKPQLDAVVAAFERARKGAPVRLCASLSSDKDRSLSESFARFASRNPGPAAALLDDLARGALVEGEVAGDDDIQRALESILRCVDWGAVAKDPDAAGFERLAGVGLQGGVGDDHRSRRKEFLGELLETGVSKLGSDDVADEGRILRNALALDAARAAVSRREGAVVDGQAESRPSELPAELAERLREAFTSQEGGVDGASWVRALVGLDEAKDFGDVKAVGVHLDLIGRFGLLPVWDPVNKEVTCYIGKRELTRQEVGLPMPVGGEGQFVAQRLQLGFGVLEATLTRLGPLRVPTAAEWKLIEGDQRFADIGELGVREWVATPNGQGKLVDTGFAGEPIEVEPGGEVDLRDVGGRAALDAVPAALKERR